MQRIGHPPWPASPAPPLCLNCLVQGARALPEQVWFAKMMSVWGWAGHGTRGPQVGVQTAHKRHHSVASSRVGKHLPWSLAASSSWQRNSEWRWWTPLGLLLLHASTEQISVQSSSSSWRHLVLCPGSVWWSSGHPQCFFQPLSPYIGVGRSAKGQRNFRNQVGFSNYLRWVPTSCPLLQPTAHNESNSVGPINIKYQSKEINHPIIPTVQPSPTLTS